MNSKIIIKLAIVTIAAIFSIGSYAEELSIGRANVEINVPLRYTNNTNELRYVEIQNFYTPDIEDNKDRSQIYTFPVHPNQRFVSDWKIIIESFDKISIQTTIRIVKAPLVEHGSIKLFDLNQHNGKVRYDGSYLTLSSAQGRSGKMTVDFQAIK